jgi:hypothetical protein
MDTYPGGRQTVKRKYVFPVGDNFPDDSGPSEELFSLSVLNRHENCRPQKNDIIAFSI